MTPARETTWTLRGLPFAALEWGDRDDPAPPVVLLHGYLDHAGAWSRVAPTLPGWRIALDQRGHGRSAWAQTGHGYFFPEYLADLDALVEAVGRPVRLVGHSMGGTVSTMYAGARPDRVVALASVDGLGLHDQADELVDRVTGFLDGVRRRPTARVMADVDAAAARLVAAYGGLDPAWARELAERGTRPVAGGVVWAYDPLHRIHSPIPYRHSHHRPLLARIACPTLVVHPGTPVFGAENVALLEGAIRDLRRVSIPGTGHMIHLQEPSALATIIADFFAGLSHPPP